MTKSARNKANKLVVNFPLEAFAMKKTPIKQLVKAAKKSVKEIKFHFETKGQGWPLWYGFYVEDIFYAAFGHHLEDYLLKELAKSKLNIALTSCPKRGSLMITKGAKKCVRKSKK